MDDVLLCIKYIFAPNILKPVLLVTSMPAILAIPAIPGTSSAITSASLWVASGGVVGT